MKKALIFILSLLLVFTLPLTCFAAFICGDNTGDGKITVEDARLCLRAAIGLEEWGSNPADSRYSLSDADRDGTLSVADARLILRAAIGLETIEAAPSYSIGQFNDAVNNLKNSEVRYTASYIEKTVTRCGDATYSGGLKLFLKSGFDEGVKELQTPETVYGEPTFNRVITKNNFYVRGCDYVSALKESDIDGISSTRTDGLVFSDTIPSSITASNNKVYDISEISGFGGGTYNKVTVTLKNTSVTADGITPVDSIYGNSYRTCADELMEEFNSINEYTDKVSSSCTMSVSGKVTYWFDAETGVPAAALYEINTFVSFTVSVNGITAIDSGKMVIPIYVDTTVFCTFAEK